MAGGHGAQRPRLSRGISDLSSMRWSAPDAVALDTSAIVEFLLPSQRAHEHWRGFFERVRRSRDVVRVQPLG